MGEKKFTLMELHLDGDTQFGPRSLPDIVPGTVGTDTETEDEEPAAGSESADEDEGRGIVPLLAGLIAMVAIGVAVRRYRRDDEIETDSFEEQDVVVN